MANHKCKIEILAEKLGVPAHARLDQPGPEGDYSAPGLDFPLSCDGKRDFDLFDLFLAMQARIEALETALHSR